MFGLKKIMVVTAVAALMAVGGVLADDARAATVSFKNGADGTGDTRFTVECTVSCQGWLFDAKTFDALIGGLIDFQDLTYAAGTGETWEENLLASVAGVTGLTFSKTPDSPPTLYSSNALYQLFKIGSTPNVGVLVNTSGGYQSYTFAQVGSGAGLSHIANYGVAPVPLPAAGILLISALGGLGFAARRWRKAS